MSKAGVKERRKGQQQSGDLGAELEKISKGLRGAITNISRDPKTGAVSKRDSALRAKALQSIDKTHGRLVEFVDNADELVEEIRATENHTRDSAQEKRQAADEEDRVERRKSDIWAREQHEERKNSETKAKIEIALTRSSDDSWERRLMAWLTVLCVTFTLGFGVIAALHENPWYLSGSASSMLLPAGGAAYLRARHRRVGSKKSSEEQDKQAVEEPPEDPQRLQAYSWSPAVPLEPLPEEE
ncbi:MAG TPA: hypothetical protein VF729_06375 [Solirubrobacterales bacterium]